ncbi:hypothetical protein EMGBS15_17330 [Filimonas sp.]|nr:hypothetical protein EMGBS15_17330 [Filimonas sp.]
MLLNNIQFTKFGIKYIDIISLSRRAISNNKLRSNLTIAIIAIGITALIAIITVIEILKGSIYTNFTSMGSNTFNISSQSMISKSNGRGKRKACQPKSGTEPYQIKRSRIFQRKLSLSVCSQSECDGHE